MHIQARVESVISEISGETARIHSYLPCYGGSINNCYLIELYDSRRFFLKSNQKALSYPGIFDLEFRALTLLNDTETIQVPKPLAWDDEFIVMEWFNEGAPAPDWQIQMGRGLAELHKASQCRRFGFEADNYLGTTLQLNSWKDNWLEFWREQRLGFQLELFSRKTDPDDQLLIQGQRLLDNLHLYLGEIDECAVLLHGDLWSGNAAATESGKPIIFDPAAYFGHREAELGMMRMFGGFTRDCEAAYDEVWPLSPGSEERIRIYRLYHELNHLNLFGRSYYESSLSTIQSLL